MATLNDLKEQAITIASLATSIREHLTKATTKAYFAANPSLAESLLTSTASIKTRQIILYGLKNAIEITIDVLPTNQEIMSSRAHTWLEEGDIIGGWISYLADVPRVIDSVELNGYRWHFLGDEENIQGPGIGYNKLDKWYQGYGWIKLTGSDIDSISEEQIEEISELKVLLNYFSSKAFLQS